MLAARQRAKLTQIEVSKRLGISQGTLSFLERLGQSTSMAAQFASLYNVDPFWLSTGERAPYAEAIAKVNELIGHTPSQVEGSVAHELIASAQTIDAQQVSWERIVSGADPGEQFVLALPDDANAPDYPMGMEIVWSRTKTPKFGSLVIVRTASAGMHVRTYQQGRKGGQWIASATAPGYASFDSDEDDLKVIATAKWGPMP